MSHEPDDHGAFFAPAPGGRPLSDAQGRVPLPAPGSELDQDERNLADGAAVWVVVSAGTVVGVAMGSINVWGGTPVPVNPMLALVFGTLVAALFPPSLLIVGALAMMARSGTRSYLQDHRLATWNGWSDAAAGTTAVVALGAVLGSVVTVLSLLGILGAYGVNRASIEQFSPGALVIAVAFATLTTRLVVRAPRAHALVGSVVGSTLVGAALVSIL